jgi:membrane-associated phospholipid phosphatase
VTPTRFDIWTITKLAKFLGRYPLLDLSVQSAIRHHVLGGLWFAGCLFVFWMQSARPGGQKARERVLTILLGSSVAIALALLAGDLVSWLPPSRSPILAHYYPEYLMENINQNSFPSESTALYAAVAAGIFSLNRVVGSALWVGVALLVSLPRIYVGGHYPSDIFAGVVLGVLGYVAARTLFEPFFCSYLGRLFERNSWPQVLGEFVVFVWILQIADEFREFVWIMNSVKYVLK